MAQDSVQHRDVTLNLETGLHLRPISMIVRLANRFDCDLTITYDNTTADARSSLDLMAFSSRIQPGSRLVVEAKGKDAESALDGIASLFESNFQEDISDD
ncbi:MAG: HPr family phosphocarrier protein [Planctomycetes bacterium]|nr:HPr family phosphocarrier protein [Planctomycetota bacterium]